MRSIKFSLWISSIILLLALEFLVSGRNTFLYAQEGFSQKNAYKGHDVFQNKGCIQCHAVYGRGGKGGPDLGKDKFFGTYLEFAAMMWNHFPRMEEKMEKKGLSFPQFSAEETEQLITYLAYIRYKGEPGNEFAGKKLLNSKGCVKCHKFGGRGGDIGPDITSELEYLSPIILVETMWNHGPDMMDIFEQNDIKRPQFKNNEIVDIAVAIKAYMSPTNRIPPGSYDLGDPSNGKILLQEKGCITCHSSRGTGGNLAPDFYSMDFNKSVTEIAGMMWNHAPEMWELMNRENITIPTFKKGEMADIIGYFYSIKLQDASGDEENGKNIVYNRDCLSCHSIKGEGSSIATDLARVDGLDNSLIVVNAMFNHASDMKKRHTEMKLEWPKLSGKDIADLVAYLNALSPAK
ncbi:MAG: cytochrome c [bacterium]|nr:MAG: cytochrome c [bacterium]